MNDNLKKLALQAGFVIDDSNVITANSNGDLETKLLADLIVKECCMVLKERVEVALSPGGIIVSTEKFLKEHFGIE